MQLDLKFELSTRVAEGSEYLVWKHTDTGKQQSLNLEYVAVLYEQCKDEPIPRVEISFQSMYHGVDRAFREIYTRLAEKHPKEIAFMVVREEDTGFLRERYYFCSQSFERSKNQSVECFKKEIDQLLADFIEAVVQSVGIGPESKKEFIEALQEKGYKPPSEEKGYELSHADKSPVTEDKAERKSHPLPFFSSDRGDNNDSAIPLASTGLK